MNDFYNIKGAAGLTAGEAAIVSDLVNVYRNNKAKNAERVLYYEDKKQVSFAGIELRDEFLTSVRTNVGWCAKGVDMLASRSVFDGVTVDGEHDELLDAVLDGNDFASEYSRAVPSELCHGYGIFTVCAGGDGEPDAVIRYFNGENSAAVWDYRKNRVEAALVIDGYERKDNGKTLSPNFCVLHTDGFVVEIKRNGTAWKVDRRLPNNMGRPMVVPMCYRPNMNPLGKSRVSRAAMRITDNMQREIFLMNVHSKKYSLPKYFITNASDEFIDAADKSKLSADEITVIGKDADGESVTIQQLSPASPETHITIMDKLAQEMAAEFGVPASVFGADTNRAYVSSDSLRSAQDELVSQAKQLCRDNGKAVKQLARMVLAIIGNTSYDGVEGDIVVHWADPAQPSESQIADAIIKEASVLPWLSEAAPDVLLKKFGYDAPTRAQIIRNKADAQAAQSLNAILLGNVKEPVDADTANAD